MSKPKYMEGDCIRSLDDLVLQENIFWNGRIWNRKWFMNLQIQLLLSLIKHKALQYAVRRDGSTMMVLEGMEERNPMTEKEIVKALRCASTPGGPTGDCEKCPYWKTEQMTAEQKEKLGVDTWTSCDVDKVGMDAADLIERLTAENAALRENVPQWISVEEGGKTDA